MSSIVKESQLVGLDNMVLLEMTVIFKIPFAFYFSNLCDRKKGAFRPVLAVSVLLHSIFATILTFLCNIPNIKLRWFSLIAIKILTESTNAVAFALIDSLGLFYRATPKQISKIKMGGSLGHLSINAILCITQLMNTRAGNPFKENRINAYAGVFFATMAFMCIMTLKKNTKINQKETFSEKEHLQTHISENEPSTGTPSTKKGFIETLQTIRSDLKALICIPFCLYTLSVCLIGTDKAVISTLLSLFMENGLGLKRTESHFVYFIRCLPEFVTYYLIGRINMKPDHMYFLAIFVSVARSFCLGLFPFSKMTMAQKIISLNAIELLKGVYSASFSFSAMRIFDSMSKNRTFTSQGVFFCFYVPLPSILFGLSGLFIKKDRQIDKENLSQLFCIVGAIACIGLIAPLYRIFFKRHSIQ